MDKLNASIVTPYGEIFSGQIDTITLPGTDGEFGVYSGHENLLSLLKAGVIEISGDGKKGLVAIDWGYAEITASKVDVIVNGAVAIGGTTGGKELADAIASAKQLLQEASDDKIAMGNVISRIESSAKSKI